MSTNEPGRTPQPAALTSLPRLEDIPQTEGGGYEPERVREAFDSFRRHALQLQAQLRVLQAAGRTANVDPTGHAVRMDALHLIRAAAEFADALENDAQTASATQLGRTEEEVTRRQRELQARAAEIERYRDESEKQRNEILNAAKSEARDLLANANRDATQELQEAEAKGARLLEQARHQATELTNSARSEVEQTLEWARAQASAMMARAQQGAEQLLRAAGMSADQLTEVSNAIAAAAVAETEATRHPAAPEPPPQALQEVPASAPPEPGATSPGEPPVDVQSEPPRDEAPAPPVSEPPVSGQSEPLEPPEESGAPRGEEDL